jgi:hypothetical protein
VKKALERVVRTLFNMINVEHRPFCITGTSSCIVSHILFLFNILCTVAVIDWILHLNFLSLQMFSTCQKQLKQLQLFSREIRGKEELVVKNIVVSLVNRSGGSLTNTFGNLLYIYCLYIHRYRFSCTLNCRCDAS